MLEVVSQMDRHEAQERECILMHMQQFLRSITLKLRSPCINLAENLCIRYFLKSKVMLHEVSLVQLIYIKKAQFVLQSNLRACLSEAMSHNVYV